MSHDAHHELNAEKVFLWLFIYTAAEVAYGYIGDWMGMGKLLLWGGLGFFAFLKGWLIAVWFMHLKFEGWIVKGLIAPTPFLILVIFFVLRPDVGANEQMDHPIGAKFMPHAVTDEETGDSGPRVLDLMHAYDGDEAEWLEAQGGGH